MDLLWTIATVERKVSAVICPVYSRFAAKNMSKGISRLPQERG